MKLDFPLSVSHLSQVQGELEDNSNFIGTGRLCPCNFQATGSCPSLWHPKSLPASCQAISGLRWVLKNRQECPSATCGVGGTSHGYKTVLRIIESDKTGSETCLAPLTPNGNLLKCWLFEEWYPLNPFHVKSPCYRDFKRGRGLGQAPCPLLIPRSRRKTQVDLRTFKASQVHRDLVRSLRQRKDPWSGGTERESLRQSLSHMSTILGRSIQDHNYTLE